MKKIIILITALTLALSFCSAALSAERVAEWTGNVNIFLGHKRLDNNDWEPVEEQDEIGIEVDFAKKQWPVNIAVDFMSSKDNKTISGVNREGETDEFNFGVRKIFSIEKMDIHPYFGGGLAIISGVMSTTMSGVTTSVDGRDLGIWLNVGVYWTLGEHFNLGLDLRRSKADADFNIGGTDRNVELGGRHAGMLLGYHW